MQSLSQVVHSAAVHANHLLWPLPMVTNVNNNKWTYFAVISLPEVTANEIYVLRHYVKSIH